MTEEPKGHPKKFPGGSWGSATITAWVKEVRGRIELVRLEIDGEIDSAGLRRVPLRRLVDEAREDYAKRVERMKRPGSYLGTSEPVPERLRQRAARQAKVARESVAVPPLEEVAEVYNESWRLGGNPTLAVAERWGRSRSAASKWVLRARDRGLLPKTEPRHAKGRRKR
jgi:hypothetical protein